MSEEKVVSVKKNEIQIKSYDLDKVEQIVDMAQTLKKHVVSQQLYSNIAGKNYVEVEGWQFAGGLLGLMPRIVRVENLSRENEVKWLAEVEILKTATGEVVTRGFAICSSKESKKAKFDEYAILSMAQTRAVGKGYRTILAWVMKMAGYEGTPAEEMEETVTAEKEIDKRIKDIEAGKFSNEMLSRQLETLDDTEYPDDVKERIRGAINSQLGQAV